MVETHEQGKHDISKEEDGYQVHVWMFKTKKKKKDSKANNNSIKTRKPSIGLTYVRGLSEKITPVFKQHGIWTLYKPFNTLRSLLV